MLFDSLPEPVRDSLYIAIGIPIVAAEELHRAGRRVGTELEERLEEVRPQLEALSHRLADLTPVLTGPVPLDELNERLDAQLRAVEHRVTELEQRVEDALDRVEEQLPDPAREMVSRTRATARDARSQLRSLIPGAA